MLSLNASVGTFSNRLGHNTYVQNPHNRNEQVIWPQTAMIDQSFTYWDWTRVPGHTNFGYPMSVDGNVFRIKQLLPLVQELEFTQPNEFEGRLVGLAHKLPKSMACCETSCVVGLPVNRVQDVCQNRAGEEHGISASELNQRFLDGERIKLDKMDFSNVVGAHQEIELVLG